MSANQDHFSEFRDHTRLKHYVLESYVARWGLILLQNGLYQNAWFIDAFAGRGTDGRGNDGSPLIAAKVAQDLCEKLKSKNLDPLPSLQIVAIEREKKHLRALIEAAKPFTDGPDACLRILPGTLSEHLVTVHDLGQAGEPKLFFLDPFGVKGLSAHILCDIMSRPRHEVLLLFSDSGARRLHGATRAESTQTNPVPQQTSFLETFDASAGTAQAIPSVDEVIEDADSPDESVEESAPTPAKAILQEAFGNHYDRAIEAVSAASPSQRRYVWIRKYMEALYDWGATYVLPFSIVDSEKRHKYYLIHAVTHEKAFTAMKDAIHHAKLRQQEEQRTGAPMIYLSTVEVNPLVQKLAHHFAGKQVRWQDSQEPDTVKAYLLKRTHALISDFPRIEQALIERGWMCKKKPRTYDFPPNAP